MTIHFTLFGAIFRLQSGIKLCVFSFLFFCLGESQESRNKGVGAARTRTSARSKCLAFDLSNWVTRTARGPPLFPESHSLAHSVSLSGVTQCCGCCGCCGCCWCFRVGAEVRLVGVCCHSQGPAMPAERAVSESTTGDSLTLCYIPQAARTAAADA